MALELKENQDYMEKARRLAREFAKDAVERDKAGGTAKIQRDLIRDSGLLRLLIPKEYGGDGQPWSSVLRIVREFARTDGSLAHLFGYHFIMLTQIHLKGTPEQKAYFYRETAKHNWFWGNSSNPIERSIIGHREGERYFLNGKKTFSSGSPDSDVLLVSWLDRDSGKYYDGVVPTRRPGVNVLDDWDNIGQRQTGSGTVVFDQVWIEDHAIVDTTATKHKVFATIVPILSQIILANIFIGSAEGAIAEAKQYTLNQSRPFLNSNVEKASQDPYIIRLYGDFWVELASAASLVDKAMEKVDRIWEKEFDLTEEERGDCAVWVAAANVAAGKAGLDVSQRIFEVMGARSTASKYGFDRFWRNIRTHTLHNPAEYKLKNVGNWVLNDQFPKPDFYS
ncbi:acyl-CoA dehydrogenase family protein [Cohnella laeviribosi]|uniref:acyl-CoA dehydrogenase family protein n=1 Tax=Cohnella laeviribosi TaxID=380174 RepID=UPI00037B204C|nr:acyl-CoA dehydrogenase family protein [Cohnella laeviribosi]